MIVSWNTTNDCNMFSNMPLGYTETPFDEIWQKNEVFNTQRIFDYEDSCWARAAYYNEEDYTADETCCLYQGRKGDWHGFRRSHAA